MHELMMFNKINKIKARVQEIHLELLNLVGHSPEVTARRAKLRQEMLEINTQIEKMTKAFCIK